MSVRCCHHLRSAWIHPEAVESPANHTCFTSGSSSLNLLISGIMARAYIALASASPCLIPYVDEISAPPLINNRIGLLYVLLSIVDIHGHVTLMLWKAAFDCVEGIFGINQK